MATEPIAIGEAEHISKDAFRRKGEASFFAMTDESQLNPHELVNMQNFSLPLLRPMAVVTVYSAAFAFFAAKKHNRGP